MLVRFAFVLCHSDFDAFMKIFLISLALFAIPQMFVSFRDDCTSSRCLFTTINRGFVVERCFREIGVKTVTIEFFDGWTIAQDGQPRWSDNLAKTSGNSTGGWNR